MNTLFKHAGRELFSLSTLFFVAVPLIMALNGPEGGLGKVGEKISGMTSNISQSVASITPDNVQGEIGQSVDTLKMVSKPIRLGMKNAGFGGGGSVYRSGARPIYLSSL